MASEQQSTLSTHVQEYSHEPPNVNTTAIFDQHHLTCTEQPGPSELTSVSTASMEVEKEQTVVQIAVVEINTTHDHLKISLGSTIARQKSRIGYELRHKLKEAKKAKRTPQKFRQLLNKHDNYL